MEQRNLVFLLLAVSLVAGQKFVIYGRMEKMTAKWTSTFNETLAVESGNAIWKDEPVRTYVCRLWRNNGLGYIRVGRYVPHSRCCALSFTGGKTECSRVQIEFLQRCPFGTHTWTPGQDGEFDVDAHRGLIIGGSKNYVDQFVCRFNYTAGGKFEELQGRLNPGEEYCAGVTNHGTSEQKQIRSTTYELLRADLSRLIKLDEEVEQEEVAGKYHMKPRVRNSTMKKRK